MNAKVRILIVSYVKDIDYLALNLKTIQKFASGFCGTTIVVPGDEEAYFTKLASEYSASLKPYQRPHDPSKWHLSAQAQKCWADAHCPDADFVLHTDSDCVFCEPVTPEDYFFNGLPVMLYESYDRMNGSPWQRVTQDVLKIPVGFEFMRRHPQVNPIGVFQSLRCYIESLHGMEFTRYVESRKPDFPWGFTEHNIIGAFAFYSDHWKPKYHWHDVAKEGTPKEKLIQFWSHGKIDDPQEISHGGNYTPASYVSRLLKHSK